MLELLWIAKARKQIGLREYAGSANNPTIISWLKRLKSSWLDDSTPWCGTFVAAMLEPDYPIATSWYRAKDWLNCGKKLDRPVYGCIVVFGRTGGGHVGFCVGVDSRGNLMILGGNQGDAVNIKPFSRDRVLGYRWPSVWPTAERFVLPLLTSDGRVSTNES